MNRLIVIQDCRIPTAVSVVEGEAVAGDELILAWRTQQRLDALVSGLDCRMFTGDAESQRGRAEAINDGFGYPFACSPLLAEEGAIGDPDKLYAYLRMIDEECGDAAVLVVHEGVVGRVIAWWLGVGILGAKLRGAHGGISILEEQDGKHVMTLFNDTRHVMDSPQVCVEVDLGTSTVCDKCPEKCRETFETE